MAEHTPGPWRIRENPRNDAETCDLSICGDIFVLADITGLQYEHQLGNARLMSIAPELLQLVKDCEESFTADDSYKLLREACRVLIAKATGAA